MWRSVMAELEAWKDSPRRKPLVVKGVRQCGKSYILEEFAKTHYDKFLLVNFERDPALCTFFDGTIDTARVLRNIGARYGTVIDKDTFVLFDEIQACPRAVTSLKYFCEDMPEYHIASAGSLLGVAIARGGWSYPVGKIKEIDMRPMTFREYLEAAGEGEICRILEEGIQEGIPEGFTDRLEGHYRDYLFVGGMPEAVDAWVRRGDPEEVIAIQIGILNQYASDFSSHVPRSEIVRVLDVWESIPKQLARDNTKFMFGHVRKGGRARELEDALKWIEQAGLVHLSYIDEAAEFPVSIHEDGAAFKVYMADVGLLGRRCGLDHADYASGELGGLLVGALTENYVMNELVAAFGSAPACWRKGTWEVDFLIDFRRSVVPIEVKAGTKVRARSLKHYIDEYRPSRAILFSDNPLSIGPVSGIPLYAAWLAKDVLSAIPDGND
ncbi:MAG: AAA family ATPase [Thermoplasmata archaeon]|nr:AAA family ATPase [Thermoplasmata archaeon]